MHTMKNILIPTDFSENAQDALSYAIGFEKGENVKFHIFHVVQPVMIQKDEVMLQDVAITNDLANSAKTNLKALEMFGNKYFEVNKIQNFKIETSVLVGDAVKLIKQKSEEVKTDMIIMGTNGAGHSNIEKMFGTVTSSLLNLATCPVILIPLGYKYSKIDNIIFSTDLLVEDSYCLWKAFNILEPHRPLVRFLHVKKKEEEHEERLALFKRYLLDSSPAISTYFHIEIGDKLEDILENYALKFDAEMIIMSKKKKNVFQRLIEPNITRKVLNKLKYVPLMIIN